MMTKKQKFEWWLYIAAMVVGLGFLIPALISAPDTLAVLGGVFLLIMLGVWSWALWIRPFFIRLKKEIQDETV